MQQLIRSSERALNWIESRLEEDGSFRDFPKDIACYYKLPTLLFLHGKINKAHKVCDYIKTHFMTLEGDFVTKPEFKSTNAAFQEFWAYPNGWLISAAHHLGHAFAQLGWSYFERYFDRKTGGVHTHRQPNSNSPRDILSTAHFGLTALYLGDRTKAEAAGRFLKEFAEKQPNGNAHFFLRASSEGKIITRFSKESALFHCVEANSTNQAYFMIGYPLGFLSKLYESTQKREYLDAARRYFDFAYCCNGNLRSFFFSHKVAWGASQYAKVANDQRAEKLSEEIVNYLLSIQEKSGCWLSGQDIYTCVDQTVEIAIWLAEINLTLTKAREA